MIAKQHRNGKKTGVERGKNGKKTGKKRVGTGKKRVGTGQKLVLNGKKTGISPNSTIWNGVERPFFAVPHLSTVFFAVPALFHTVLDDFRQKREKKVVKNGGTGKEETRSFQFLSRSRFLPFLSTHISTVGFVCYALPCFL